MPATAPLPSAPPALIDDGIVMPMCAIFRRFLKRQGLKFTTERALILDAVLSQGEGGGVFEAEELLSQLRGTDARVSKATIYRTLKHLLEANIISEVLIDAARAHYQLSFGRTPKGHMVCVETGRVIEFPTTQLDELMERIAAEHGFEPLSHRFVVYGVSPEAQAEHKADEGEHD